MRISVVSRCQIDGLHAQPTADPIPATEEVPRLWPALPVAVQRQLAQQMAQLLRRLRASAGQAEETHDAERSVGD